MKSYPRKQIATKTQKFAEGGKVGDYNVVEQMSGGKTLYNRDSSYYKKAREYTKDYDEGTKDRVSGIMAGYEALFDAGARKYKEKIKRGED